MGKLFNKTYFRFLMGFLAIIAVSFIILVIAGSSDSQNQETEDSTVEVSE